MVFLASDPDPDPVDSWPAALLLISFYFSDLVTRSLHSPPPSLQQRWPENTPGVIDTPAKIYLIHPACSGCWALDDLPSPPGADRPALHQSLIIPHSPTTTNGLSCQAHSQHCAIFINPLMPCPALPCISRPIATANIIPTRLWVWGGGLFLLATG